MIYIEADRCTGCSKKLGLAFSLIARFLGATITEGVKLYLTYDAVSTAFLVTMSWMSSEFLSRSHMRNESQLTHHLRTLGFLVIRENVELMPVFASVAHAHFCCFEIFQQVNILSSLI